MKQLIVFSTLAFSILLYWGCHSDELDCTRQDESDIFLLDDELYKADGCFSYPACGGNIQMAEFETITIFDFCQNNPSECWGPWTIQDQDRIVDMIRQEALARGLTCLDGTPKIIFDISYESSRGGLGKNFISATVKFSCCSGGGSNT